MSFQLLEPYQLSYILCKKYMKLMDMKLMVTQLWCSYQLLKKCIMIEN